MVSPELNNLLDLFGSQIKDNFDVAMCLVHLYEKDILDAFGMDIGTFLRTMKFYKKMLNIIPLQEIPIKDLYKYKTTISFLCRSKISVNEAEKILKKCFYISSPTRNNKMQIACHYKWLFGEIIVKTIRP